jgi:hypothetical protein
MIFDIIDAERVDQAIVVDKCNHFVEANRFAAVLGNHHATRDVNPKSKIEGYNKHQAVGSVSV